MARPRGESKRTGTSPPRAAIIQRSRRVQCHKLSVTHRPTCRVLARPRRIKNSRCNDRYFSTGHRDRAYCLTETDWRNGGASAGAARVISLDGQRGCKTDKYYGRADCAYTSTRLPFSLHCYRLPSTYLKISGISVPSMRIIISRRSLFFFFLSRCLKYCLRRPQPFFGRCPVEVIGFSMSSSTGVQPARSNYAAPVQRAGP